MERLRSIDLGAVIFGLLVLGVGVYYLLENTFGINLPPLDWDKLWPLAIVALGIGIVWGARGRTGRGEGTPRS